MEVQIYIETDLKDPRKGRGRYGYVIECVKDGKPVTREGFGMLEEATQARLTLTALIEAISRLTKPCVIKILTDCSSIQIGINQGWVYEWQRAGWKTAHGAEVKNADLWKQLFDKAAIHALSITDEKSPYTMWLQEEMRKHE